MMQKMEDRLTHRMAKAFADAMTTTVLPVLVNAIADKKPERAQKASLRDQEQSRRDTEYASLQDSVFTFARSKGGDPEECMKELLVTAHSIRRACESRGRL